jgi:hypothetical protein
MKAFGNVVLMATICIVIFWVFMALLASAAHAQEMDLHHGDNVVMLFLEKADGQKYVGSLNTKETCTEVLEMLERRSKAGLETWMTLARGGKPERILKVICIGTPHAPQ